MRLMVSVPMGHGLMAGSVDGHRHRGRPGDAYDGALIRRRGLNNKRRTDGGLAGWLAGGCVDGWERGERGLDGVDVDTEWWYAATVLGGRLLGDGRARLGDARVESSDSHSMMLLASNYTEKCSSAAVGCL